MSLQEFREYVETSGVVFDGLSNEEKRQWREAFDKSRVAYLLLAAQQQAAGMLS
jgi:hypothetical protein